MANEHSNIVPNMSPTAKVADFKFWCQKVLPLVYDDSLSYYEVLNKVVVYLNQVITNINADIDNVEELEADFLLLQSYVNNFFDDIDQLVTYTERAEAAETAANGYAASAAESATNASTSSLAAMDARDAAVAAKTAAETALSNAQTAATNAAASATAADASATNAAASATAASNSATSASNSATAASNSATSASGSATNAAASAASALQNFQLADSARVAAQSAANDAETASELINMDATASDVGKAIIVKTVSGGKVTTYEFGESGGGGGGGIAGIVNTIENVPIASFDDGTNSSVESLVVDITPVQSGSGEPSHENVRPISGWTGCEIMQSNKNLFDPDSPNHWYINANQEKVLDSNARAVIIPCQQGDIFNIGVERTQASAVAISFADVSGNVLSRAGSTVQNVTATAPATSAFAYLTCQNINYASKLWANKGSVLTEYTEFQGRTVQIAFPNEAGTVYYGIIDVTNGKLYSAPYYASYNGETLTGHWISDRDVYAEGTTPTIGAQVVNDGGMLTEYSFTAQQLNTLLGVNNIWADTGKINILQYNANSKIYIDEQNTLVKSAIAPVLTEFIADTTLAPNDFRFVNNDLYKITANIANGGTITPNTNATKTTVGEVLKALLNA